VLVDSISATYLKGTEIEYLETLEASGFRFNNPNSKNTCGCGKSFSV
jgi:iron-sulfur cluster assembly accessory protein